MTHLRHRRLDADKSSGGRFDRDGLSIAATAAGRFDQLHRADGTSTRLGRRRRAHHRTDVAFGLTACDFPRRRVPA